MAAAIRRRSRSYQQAVDLESREQAAEIAGVEIQSTAEIDNLGSLTLGQLKEEASLGEGIGRIQ
jgi:hypothetical protein